MAKEKNEEKVVRSPGTPKKRDADRKQQAEVATTRTPVDPQAREALGLD